MINRQLSLSFRIDSFKKGLIKFSLNSRFLNSSLFYNFLILLNLNLFYSQFFVNQFFRDRLSILNKGFNPILLEIFFLFTIILILFFVFYSHFKRFFLIINAIINNTKIEDKYF